MKNILNLNKVVSQHHPIDIYRTLKPTTAEYIFLLKAHRVFIKIAYIRTIAKSQ